jgi:hypothetical protein
MKSQIKQLAHFIIISELAFSTFAKFISLICQVNKRELMKARYPPIRTKLYYGKNLTQATVLSIHSDFCSVQNNEANIAK